MDGAAAAATVLLLFGHSIVEVDLHFFDRDANFRVILYMQPNSLLLTNLIKEFLFLYYMASCSLPLPL